MKYPFFQFDPAFVEETVFLYMQENPGNDAITFHARREELYNTASTEEREEAFRQFYEEYFTGLGLRAVFERVLEEFPIVSAGRILIYVKKVSSSREEESELYVAGGVRTIFIGLRCVRILDQPWLESFLRFELMHAADMLDTRFGYTPHPQLKGETEVTKNLHRARFRLLWNIYVDARLRRKGLPGFISEEREKFEFGKLFHFAQEDERALLWRKIKDSHGLTQADLLGLADISRLEETDSSVGG